MSAHIHLDEASIQKQTTTLNLGPTHPATHGVFQNILEMDGERIVSAVPTVGYIHRAFEKIAERRPYYQITPLTDRLNYCSSPINNMGWHITVERLLGIKTPKRVDYLRVIIMELSRIADHLVCNSVIGVDTGALTSFVYVFEFREHIYEIFEAVEANNQKINKYFSDFKKFVTHFIVYIDGKILPSHLLKSKILENGNKVEINSASLREIKRNTMEIGLK